MNKQIETIATIIYDELCECVRIRGFDTCDFCECINEEKDCNIGHRIAKELYNAGYTRKVNDDEVVISKEEYEKLQKHYLFMQDYTVVEVLERECKHTQKEMIGEILQEVSNAILVVGLEYNLSGYLDYSRMCEDIHNKVMNKLSEKYGVEVE